jgi:hypothetical protein
MIYIFYYVFYVDYVVKKNDCRFGEISIPA